jgi:heat shock protein HslJ
MFMMARVTLAVLSVLSLHAAAAEPRTMCFGNEPSWGLEFTDPGRARLLLPDSSSVEFRGSETRLDVLHERVWRGRPATGGGGELVAFLSDSACSDGMSDRKHPMTARVSLADGRFLAGCCRIVPAAAAPESAAPIEGPTWRLADLRGLDPGVFRGATRPVTADFKSGRVSGFSGCNQFFGSYTLEGDRISIGPLAGSMMACDESAMAIENAVHAALAGTFRYVVTDDLLRLFSGADLALQFQAERSPALEGTEWNVTGFNNGRHAVVSPLSGTTLSVSFKDGVVAGFAGCNRFRATYTAEADRIAIAPPAVTRMACSGDGVMQQEQAFLSALASATSWGFMGNALDMHRADGERVLTAAGH